MTSARSSKRLVLLATGVGSEPRGAWFKPAHAADLVQAASQGGLRLVEVEVEAHALQSLDPTVAAGYLMAAGRRAALPPMRPATFNVLVALPGIVAPPRQLEETVASTRKRNQHSRGSGTVLSITQRRLKLGSIVLASFDVSEDWFEAEIVAMAGDGLLRLRWRDFRELNEFTKTIACVAGTPASR